MRPKQTVRLLSLSFLVPLLSALIYLAASGRRTYETPIWVPVLGVVYLAVVLIFMFVYVLRHRSELRDPPEKIERQKQWGLKNGGTVINVLIVIYLLNVVAGAYLLHQGSLDRRRSIATQISIAAALPAIALMVRLKRRLRIRAAKQDRNA